MNDQHRTALQELQIGLLFTIAGSVSGSPLSKLAFSIVGSVWIVGATVRAVFNIFKA